MCRKKRYFRLRQDIHALCYYPDEDSLVLLGAINLSCNSLIWNVKAAHAGNF